MLRSRSFFALGRWSRKWRGRDQRCPEKSSALRRCCWTCRRSIRSTWRFCREWTARVRGRGSRGWCPVAWGIRGAPGAHELLASVAVVAEFGRIAVEFLRRGSNPKIYEGAASKTGRVAARGSAGLFFGTL